MESGFLHIANVDQFMSRWMMLISLPVIAFLILVFIKKNKATNLIALLPAFAILTFASFHFIAGTVNETFIKNFEWLNIANININLSIMIDQMSIHMIFMIAFITALVIIFSYEYMRGEEEYSKYFAYINLFMFSMIALVLSANLFVTYMCWELLGFSSYLLIGFYNKKQSAILANKKAFIVNRIGDIGFLVGLMILLSVYQTFDYRLLKEYQFEVLKDMSLQQQWLLSISGYCFLIAVIAKSAQFPLHIWLPDAMEGPTPISALIHAATMVIAGIYLLIRLQFLLSIDVHNTMIVIGSFTSFMAAFIALKQYDLKKILAYSTISQLGYMLSAIGAASENAAFNHLYAHAFYKASLFLSAGSIIHFLHHHYHYKNEKDAQDIRNAQGLIKHLPITFIAFTFSAASLIGIPLFSGSFSKDAVILEVFDFSIYQGSVLLEIFAILNLATVFLTALYMFRVYWYLFLRSREKINTKIEESKIVKIVLLILVPFTILNVSSFKNTAHTGIIAENIYYILIALFALAFYIIYSYYKKERRTNNFIFKLSANELYIDTFYQKTIVKLVLLIANSAKFFDKVIVDGIVNQSANFTIFIAKIADGIDRYIIDAIVNNTAIFAKRIGDLIRAFQTGKVQSYFALSVFILFIIILILKA